MIIKKLLEKIKGKEIDVGDIIEINGTEYLVTSIFDDEVFLLDEKTKKEIKKKLLDLKNAKIKSKFSESKDVQSDYSEQFQIAIVPKEEVIVVKQLFGYYTKYPIYITNIDSEIKDKIKTLEKYDVDVTSVTTISGKDDISLQISVNVDSKDLEDTLSFNIILSNGKESIKKI